jgi:ATP-dependent Clp protease ATP-binding subunit ClpA
MSSTVQEFKEVRSTLDSRPILRLSRKEGPIMLKKMNWLSRGVLGLAILLAACRGAEKEATEGAINAAQTAINAASSEAAKYLPDQLKSAQETLQSAKDAWAKGDYPAALSGAKDASKKASDLVAAAAARKQELMKDWTSLSESLPKSMEQIKARLDAYSHGARMPEGVDKSVLATAKDQYAQLKQAWADATAAAQQGKLGDAMQKASGIKEMLEKLREMLGIKS